MVWNATTFLVKSAKVMGDIYYSQFKDSYLIEMYLENFEQFGGNGDMLSKFGLV